MHHPSAVSLRAALAGGVTATRNCFFFEQSSANRLASRAHSSLFFALLLILRSLENGRQVFLPFGPVAINELSHVLGLFFWVGQVDICRMLRSLIRIPLVRHAPRFSAWFFPRCCEDAQRQSPQLPHHPHASRRCPGCHINK